MNLVYWIKDEEIKNSNIEENIDLRRDIKRDTLFQFRANQIASKMTKECLKRNVTPKGNFMMTASNSV